MDVFKTSKILHKHLAHNCKAKTGRELVVQLGRQCSIKQKQDILWSRGYNVVTISHSELVGVERQSGCEVSCGSMLLSCHAECRAPLQLFSRAGRTQHRTGPQSSLLRREAASQPLSSHRARDSPDSQSEASISGVDKSEAALTAVSRQPGPHWPSSSECSGPSLQG